jgi:hypothetical protein
MPRSEADNWVASVEPKLEMLPTGDMLVPFETDAGWHIMRVTPEDYDYADWLSIVQRKKWRPGLFGRAVRVWVAAALVFFAIVIGVPLIVVTILAIAHG